MARKLSLDLDALTVTTYDTGDGEIARGTVDAHEDHVLCPYSKTDSCPLTAALCPSIDVSCAV